MEASTSIGSDAEGDSEGAELMVASTTDNGEEPLVDEAWFNFIASLSKNLDIPQIRCP